MASEMIKRDKMNAETAPVEYVGAYIEDEARLMLVSVDPTDPWDAFRKLRRTLRRSGKAEKATTSLFESLAPIEHSAEVISLESRRRAG